jgi:hypothetical protein
MSVNLDKKCECEAPVIKDSGHHSKFVKCFCGGWLKKKDTK